MGESISTPVPGKPVEDAGEEKDTVQEPLQLDQDASEAPGAEPAGRQLYQNARAVPVTKSESRKLYEEAVENAQYMMAYAAGKCMKDIDEATVEKLILARRRVENSEELSAKEEAEFWIAYQELWKLVRPLTAECIRATEGPKARKTINWHIGFTIVVLLLLLVLQIYWVIGNQLTTRLADLLKLETELNQKISINQGQYNAIELRFMLDEMESENFDGYYTYYSNPEFERETAENRFEYSELETELAGLISQRERNNEILKVWSKPWQRFIEPSTTEEAMAIDTEITSNQQRIDEIKRLLNTNSDSQLTEEDKASLSDELTYWEDVNASLTIQKQNEINQNKSSQAQLAALFVLTILQSYLLPLFYGLLGASTSSLRSLSREIDEMVFSDKKRIQHVLRIALGALTGIMVGWFSFLYEGTTLLRSVPPLAIAFLVGYNIELFFSLMDRVIDAVKRSGKPQTDKDAQAQTPPAPTPAAQ